MKVLDILLHLLHIHQDQLMVPKLEELVLVLQFLQYQMEIVEKFFLDLQDHLVLVALFPYFQFHLLLLHHHRRERQSW
jgi:hypothetical protein